MHKIKNKTKLLKLIVIRFKCCVKLIIYYILETAKKKNNKNAFSYKFKSL